MKFAIITAFAKFARIARRTHAFDSLVGEFTPGTVFARILEQTLIDLFKNMMRLNIKIDFFKLN